MKCFFLALSLSVCIGHMTHAISLLDAITNYAHSMPEYPSIAKKIWGNSDFTEFHKQNAPNLFMSFLESWGYRSKDFFSITYFKQTIEDTIAQRNQKQFKRTIAVKIRCPENSKLIVFDSLRGNFHRLIRSLKWLQTQEVIDENLVLLKKNHYLFMSGYSINGSAYSLETLTILLLLINRNPDNVFLLRSRQELNNHWNDFGLKRALKVRVDYQAGPFADSLLIEKLNNIFDSLPKSAYVLPEFASNDYIEITSSLDESDEINTTMMGNFFDPDDIRSLAYLNEDQLEKTTKVPHIKASIKTENLDLRAQRIFGLVFMELSTKTAFWSIFPFFTPNDTSKAVHMNDAYVEVDIKSTLDTSVIKFVERETDKNDFTVTSSFNLVSGISTESPYVAATLQAPIAIGSTMSLINGVPYIGREIKEGMVTRITTENQLGGIHGHLLKTSIYNDDYSPELSLLNIKKLLDDSITLILLPVGSPTLKIYFDYVKNNTISVFFPVTGSSVFRIPPLEGIIHLRASYDDEIHFLIEYLTESLGLKKFAFLYQDDSYGQDSAAAAHKALQERKDTSWIDLAYTREAINFESQIKKIREYEPEAIGFFSTAQAGRLLILQMGVNEAINKHFFANSFIAEKSFRFFVKEFGLRFLFSSTVPDPVTSQTLIAQEYRQAMDTLKKTYDRFSFESYIGTDLFINVLKEIDEPITRQKIMNKLESLHDYNYKGLILDFDPLTRSLAQSIWLEMSNSPEWIEKNIKDRKR